MPVVCFDLCNTLITAGKKQRGYEIILQRFGLQKEQLYPFVRDVLMVKKEITYREMVEELFQHLGLEKEELAKLETERLWAEDNKSYVWLSGAQDCLGQLHKRGIRLVLISNLTFPAWQEIDSGLDVSSMFDELFLSCMVGISKPNPDIFRKVVEQFAYEKFWMIGDSQLDDIEPAKLMDWQTILVPKSATDFPLILRSLL